MDRPQGDSALFFSFLRKIKEWVKQMQVPRVQPIFWHMCTSQTCTSIVVPSFWGILKFFLTYLNLTDTWPPNLKGAPIHDPLSKIRPLTASIRMILKSPKTKWPPVPIFSVLRENPIFISFEQTQLFRPLFRFQQILSFLNFLLFSDRNFRFQSSVNQTLFLLSFCALKRN